MSSYIINSDTLISIADSIREINGIEATLSTSEMKDYLNDVNSIVSSQQALIDQISGILTQKASSPSSVSTCTVILESPTTLVEVVASTFDGESVSTYAHNTMSDGSVLTIENVICNSAFAIGVSFSNLTTFTLDGAEVSNTMSSGRTNLLLTITAENSGVATITLS